ncbi:MAG TPA: hypothetical protein VJL90_15275 [Pseudorhodoplanes sp.]|nr:hypothetical protein [Pseudorhodoplanes sp.]
MREMEIRDVAQQWLQAHGDKALVEAAQKTRTLEEQGRHKQAITWKRVEAALQRMRGPHQS